MSFCAMRVLWYRMSAPQPSVSVICDWGGLCTLFDKMDLLTSVFCLSIASVLSRVQDWAVGALWMV